MNSLFTIVLFICISQIFGQGCRNNADCGNDRVCVKGNCQRDICPRGSTLVNRDQRCRNEQECQGDRCANECNGQGGNSNRCRECRATFTCEKVFDTNNGVCCRKDQQGGGGFNNNNNNNFGRCQKNRDCQGNDKVCIDGNCRNDICPRGSTLVNGDQFCSNEQECQREKCEDECRQTNSQRCRECRDTFNCVKFDSTRGACCRRDNGGQSKSQGQGGFNSQGCRNNRDCPGNDKVCAQGRCRNDICPNGLTLVNRDQLCSSESDCERDHCSDECRNRNDNRCRNCRATFSCIKYDGNNGICCRRDQNQQGGGGFNGPNNQGCQNNRDCPGQDRVCVQGRCRNDVCPGASTLVNRDQICLNEQDCQKDRCADECRGGPPNNRCRDCRAKFNCVKVFDSNKGVCCRSN